MQPDLGDIRRKIEEGRDFLDNLMLKVPGFKGYVEHSEVYDADRIIRNFMSDRIIDFKKVVDSSLGELVKSGEGKLLPELDSLNLILERVLKKTKYADYASSSFSGIKVTVEDQDRILGYDWNLVQVLDEVGGFVERMRSTDSKELLALIKDIKKRIDDFEKAFDGRKSVILEVL
jgi:hypothetical protein